MKAKSLHEIRKEFLEFFEEKEHLVVDSYSLIPHDDKSLLLVGAGMAPLKKYFTGEAKPPRKRMASCQKCIRTGDIENVGKTSRHATFFEMLGNFSFGDYFKKEAIEWAWEFLEDRMGVPAEDMWVSVYEEDDEAYDIWKDHMNISEDKIVRLGKEDNFWELEVGPSGPCSEIYIDRGLEYGCGSDTCQPGCECDRFIEVWNLVFTQFDKDEKGVYHPLKHPNIDTGMGLERIAAILQGADNIFEVDAIESILNKIEGLAKYNYGSSDEKDESVRVITDHARAMTFLVSDGVVPSNEGRGYVLRRLIRRAARHGKLLGIEGEFLKDVVDETIDSWKVEYKDLENRRDLIVRVIRAEEEKFQETIDQGLSILDSYIDDMDKDEEKVLSGKKAFKLYDTYGFPIDLTKEILEEKGLLLDEEEFTSSMEEQRERARKARQESDSGWGNDYEDDLFAGLHSNFKGYEDKETFSQIIGIFLDNDSVSSLKKDDEAIVILDQSPFYGESGGQVGDKGFIENENFKAEVIDTQLSKDGLILHMIKIIEGEVQLNEHVRAYYDMERRSAIRRNHSVTHLLHQALRDVLGEHVNQAGSLVMDKRMRFDFTHYESPTKEELLEIERIVNDKILEGLKVETIETSLEEAERMGAIGLFEDKYEDKVRIVRMGDYSMELCGGTHVDNTSNIGLFKILSEGGIAAGVRRIESITGMEVYNHLNNLEGDLDLLAHNLKTNRTNLLEKSQSLIEDFREKDREIEKLKGQLASDIAGDIVDQAQKIGDISLVTYKTDDMDVDSLRNLGDQIRDRLDSAVILLASTKNGRIVFIAMVTKDLNKRGILAGNVVREVAQATGGNGGGRPDMAQAGGKDLSKLDDALAMLPKLIEKDLK